MKTSDELLLKLAVELAEGGRFTCAPNPTVGCVIVRDGRVIGRGWHKKAGEGHAEVEAIAAADGDVAGATVYVSLEPCAFAGRTPSCAKTLVAAGVSRVVIAALDPHPKVSGQGIDILRQAGIQTDTLVLPEAQRLIEGYQSVLERKRPFVRIKTASSVDGATALATGESQWITGPAAREDVQYWRARSDAIITGIGTVLADDPALTVRAHAAKPPLRVVLDSRLRIPPDAQLLSDGGPTLLVHSGIEQPPKALQAVECLALEDDDLEALLAELAERGCNEVLIEAGARVVGSFVKAGLWDEWIAYVAPAVLGSASAPLVHAEYTSMAEIQRAEVIDSKIIGDDVRLTLRPRTK